MVTSSFGDLVVKLHIFMVYTSKTLVKPLQRTIHSYLGNMKLKINHDRFFSYVQTLKKPIYVCTRTPAEGF